MVLECSSRGDIRFSAFGAYITLFGKTDFIENWYQTSKRFGNKIPKSWRDAKGKYCTHININGYDYNKKYLHDWYKILWCIYLDKNPNLIEYAKKFDDYRDFFKTKNGICQADVIRQYIKNGRSSIISDCSVFLNEIITNNKSRRE